MTADDVGPDPCGMVLLATAAAWAGHRTVRARPRAQASGGFVGVVAFLGAALGGLAAGGPPAGVLVCAGVVAGFALAVAWTVLAGAGAIWDGVRGVIRTVRASLRRLAVRWETWRQAARTRQAARRALASCPDPAAVARAAEADRADREQAIARRRRADARAACEVYYGLHGPELAGRFSRDVFADFVARHLGDEHPPDLVERRAGELLAVLKQHLERVEPAAASRGVDEILAAYVARRQKIEQSALDERDKQVLLIQMDEQRERDVSKAIREGRL